MNVISVHDLAKTFRVGLRSRRVEAVRCVSFEVEQNQIVGFVGPNGAGKSTTIHMLLGLVHASAGQGTMFGEPLGSVAARRRVGYLPELPNLYGYLKARELLEMTGRLAGMSQDALRRDVSTLLERVDLADKGELYLRTFSKGMLQRVGLAQALLNDPDLVILDEPMSGLDPIGRHIVRGVILDLKARGKTVFFSSHVLPDIEALCDRVVLIANGEILRVASVEELVRGGEVRYELQVRGPAGPPEDQRGLLEVRRAGDSLHLIVEGEAAAGEALDWARGAGQLLAMVPMHESLEDVVLREIASSAGEELS